MSTEQKASPSQEHHSILSQEHTQQMMAEHIEILQSELTKANERIKELENANEIMNGALEVIEIMNSPMGYASCPMVARDALARIKKKEKKNG